jgi:hypothetical protein
MWEAWLWRRSWGRRSGSPARVFATRKRWVVKAFGTIAEPSGSVLVARQRHGTTLRWADSAGQRKKLGELLRWFHESERLAGTVVEASSDVGQVLRAVRGQVGALGQVLA